jgi:glutamine synthetase
VSQHSDVSARIAKELDRLDADIVHVGLFDFAGMFRERRLRRADLLSGADHAMFANVLPKWDAAESILAPGPYGSETIAYHPESIRPYPFEPRAAAMAADYAGPQAEIMPRRVLARQVERAKAAGFEVLAAYEFEFILLNETAVLAAREGLCQPQPLRCRQSLLVRPDRRDLCQPCRRSRKPVAGGRGRSALARRRAWPGLPRGDVASQAGHARGR